MSRIVIIGGHGKVALQLAPLLVEQGHEVTSIFRNPQHHDDVAATGATPQVADVQTLGTDELVDHLRGHDAVLWSAGAGGGDSARTYAVDRDAAIRTMDAAEAAGVQRYVMVSFLGASLENLPPADDDFFPYADAKVAADEHLRESALGWTILQPGALTLDDPTGKIDVLAVPTGDASVSRADVAAVAAAVLADDSTTGRTIGFRNGATPIVEALQA